jgi:hypothetical protein
MTLKFPEFHSSAYPSLLEIVLSISQEATVCDAKLTQGEKCQRTVPGINGAYQFYLLTNINRKTRLVFLFAHHSGIPMFIRKVCKEYGTTS